MFGIQLGLIVSQSYLCENHEIWKNATNFSCFHFVYQKEAELRKSVGVWPVKSLKSLLKCDWS